MFNILDRILPWLFVVCVGFVLVSAGIASAHFKWWPAPQLEKQFAVPPGKTPGNIIPRPSQPTVSNYVPTKSFGGYTLLTKRDSSAMLVDMNGTMVYSWQLPYEKIWAASRTREAAENPYLAFATVYPNGDLLGVYHASSVRKDPIYGMGLVKMDKNAKVLWEFSQNVHDTPYVAQSGEIYALVHEMNPPGTPVEGLHYIEPPRILDSVAVLSSDGKLQKRYPLLPAFLGTPYEQYLYAARIGFRYIQTVSVLKLEG
ncbi:MAG: hypothetical protein K2Q01_05605, partial [Rickettsiales bacterium]|nr:hypothetical protein [Rickettsiales bacterium]